MGHGTAWVKLPRPLETDDRLLVIDGMDPGRPAIEQEMRARMARGDRPREISDIVVAGLDCCSLGSPPSADDLEVRFAAPGVFC